MSLADLPNSLYTRWKRRQRRRRHYSRNLRRSGVHSDAARKLAESAPTLNAYQTLFALGQTSSLSPAEQQIVYIAVSAMHGCEYCVAGHTYLGRAAKLEESALQALLHSQN
jgi:AhpD family alkylhydroperoxidase